MDWLNYLVLFLYVAVIVCISIYTRKSSSSTKDFFLGGEGVGGWMSAFSYGVTYFSAVIFIGYAGKFGWNFGLAASWIGIGNAVIGSYLAWKLLATRTRNITLKLKVSTMPEFFEKRFFDSRLKLFSAIIIFVFLMPYSASVYQGLGYMFELVFKIDFNWCIIIMAALTAVYVFFGGYLGTVLTNFFQGMIMLIGVVVMLVVFLSDSAVSFPEGLKFLSENGLGLIPQGTASGGSFIDAPWFNVLIVTLLTSFGVWGMPQVIHKFYAVKSKKAINQAVVISTAFCLIIGFGAYFVGGISRLFLDTLPAGGTDYVMPAIILKIMPAGLLGLIVVLLLSASMSTLSSLSMSGASSIAIDIYKGQIKKDASDKEVKILLKILCVVYIIISAVIAIFNIDAIVTMMGLSWGTLAGCFIGPYIFGIYSKKTTKASVWASLIAGLVVTIALVLAFGIAKPHVDFTGLGAILKGGISRSPLIGVIAMIVSVIITPLVSCFTKKPDAEKIDEMFENITVIDD